MLLFLCSLFAAATATPLSNALDALQFLHEDTVRATDAFVFHGLKCGYLVAANISGYVRSWGEGGSCPYLWKVNGTSPPPSCTSVSPIASNTDMPGHDLAASELPAGSPATACQARCCATEGCFAFAYAPSAPADFLGCAKGSTCCYLKDAVGDTHPTAGISSGSVTPANPNPNGPGLAPPLGMRSSVPLGGLGAGAMELRADGTFQEVSIQNAHPAAAAKQGVLADAVLGYRVDAAGAPPFARALRTQPPPYAAGVSALSYSGAYPASRLRAEDPASPITAALFAYAPFTPGSEATMAHPAAAFSLRITSTSPNPLNVSLYLALPWGAINDCDRTADGKNTISANPLPTAAACLQACAQLHGCAAWTQGADGVCRLTSAPNLVRFREGATCAVAGGWVASGGGGVSYLGDGGGASPGAPALGGVTLRPAPGASGAVALVGADPASLWQAFANPGAPLPSGVAPPDAAPLAAGFASLTATVAVPANGDAEVSIVWSWHFPNKDWDGQFVGNFYTNLWNSSDAVAEELCEQGRLASVVADINAHHVVLMGPPPSSPLPPSPIPDWLRDVLVNQVSHFKMMHWTKDNRMREYEAPDCPDVDSVR